MPDYAIKAFPQEKYRFRLIDNPGGKSLAKLKQELGCYALVNLGYYNMATFRIDSATMFAGKWACRPVWHTYGVCIDQAGAISLGTEKEAVYDYCIAQPPAIIDGKEYSKAAHENGDANGLTWVGFRADKTPVILVAGKDKPKPSAWAAKMLTAAGCVHCLRYDGSWSSQCDLGGGDIVTPSRQRNVRILLAVYERNTKEETTVNGKAFTVCLDPGHGPGTMNGSPDKSYYEKDFAWDMYQRLKPLLERQGIKVVGTRAEDTKPSLTARCKASNQAKADLFLSLHSDAQGGSGWGTVRGLHLYTSSGPNTAKRNQAARALLSAFQSAGVRIHGDGMGHNMSYTVLVETEAPAVLIEYGFHTNKEDVALLKDAAYREKLAEATAKGVCAHFGLAYQATAQPEQPPNEMALAWKKAASRGVLDGTRPKDPATREELAVVLDRLGLLD